MSKNVLQRMPIAYLAGCKAGRWEEAAALVKNLGLFGRRGRWAGARDEIARAMMFAGHYSDAALMWGQMRGYAPTYRAFYVYECRLPTGHRAVHSLTTKSNGWDAAAFIGWVELKNTYSKMLVKVLNRQ